MTESVSAAVAQSFDQTVADLKDGVATATTTYRDLSEKTARSASDAAAFHQGTLEAYTEASQILAQGSQELFRQWTATSRDALQETLSGMRALMGVKSTSEAIELQASFARTAAAWMVSESSRFAQAGIDLAEKVSAPLTARAVAAAEKVSTFKA